MKTIQAITSLGDGGYDVIFDEDGGRYAAQIYNRKEAQTFSWAEVQAALPSKLDAIPDPLPDLRTSEEIKNDREIAIKSKLIELDKDIPRVVEDLIKAVQDAAIPFTLDQKKQAILNQKIALRDELEALV